MTVLEAVEIVRTAPLLAGVVLLLLPPACVFPDEARQEDQWDSMDQLWKAEPSQVQLRDSQSRVFNTTDRLGILAAVIGLMQDLGFTIQVLDEDLGIVSGKRFAVPGEGVSRAILHPGPTYYLYDENSLLSFSSSYRTWGPFQHREDLIRLTVTVRPRETTQSVVRANLQFFMRALENPEPYQRFFARLAESLQLEAQ